MQAKVLWLILMRRAWLYLAIFLSLSWPVWGEGDNSDLALSALSPRQKVEHVLGRMGFGPAPGQVEQVLTQGLEVWIEAQLDPSAISDQAAETFVAQHYPSLAMTMGQALATYRPLYPEDREETLQETKERNRLREQVRHALQSAVLYRAVHSQRQFQEVILEFWRNHFSIDQNKDDVTFLANHYEQTLREHAFGSFEDLLLATAQHPAMLIYLDNIVSQKPLTAREQKRVERYETRRYQPRSVLALARQRGLNENYARELMELHTLGVDQGYSQHDVTELARVLTGWSAQWDAKHQDYGFHFRAEVHDTQPKKVLGTTLRGKGGQRDGIAIIRKLANDKRTAQFISRKLCRYLVCDNPPDALVQQVAKVFTETQGDLPSVYRAIVTSDTFFDPVYVGAKFKTPFEFVVSSLRATSADIADDQGILWMLHQMGQPIYQCLDPTGYDDRAEAWLDPGVLVYRWRFAIALAHGHLEGITIPRSWTKSWSSKSGPQADALLDTLAHVPMTFATRALMIQQLRKTRDKRTKIGLALGSPMFQQQ